jgi:hypothetical protein
MVAYNGQFSVIIIYDTHTHTHTHTHTERERENPTVTVRSEALTELIFDLYSLVKKNKIWF